MGPGMAMIIGTVAGAISTVGFCSTVAASVADTDTCGINNLHGMPGIFGGLMSAVVPLMIKHDGVEPVDQVLGLLVTLVISIVTGFGTGKVLKAAGSAEEAYNDLTYWETAD
jgi:ammonium transporter Rh